MSPRFAFFLGCAALTVTACDAGSREVTLRIDHYREPCEGDGPGFCYRVLESSDPTIREVPAIGGFEFDEGHVYELVVLVDDYGEGDAFDLVDVLNQEPVPEDEHFELVLGPAWVQRVDDGEFQLVAASRAYCSNAEVCQGVGRALVDDRPFEVELSHHPAESGAFIAHHVTEL